MKISYLKKVVSHSEISPLEGSQKKEGVYSLNYILEHLQPNIPDRVVRIGTDFKDRSQSSFDPNRVRVAILDSGLGPKHVPNNSLFYDPTQGNMVCPLNDSWGWNFIDDNDTLSDDRGHGTLIALSYFHALYKMSPNIEIDKQSLIIVKVLNECGEGTTYSTICGLRYAELRGAKIINASWGIYQNDRQLQRAVEALHKKGIIIVSSDGNTSLDLSINPHFPSGYAAPFDYIVDEDKIVAHPGMSGVIDVGGMCKYITDSCPLLKENIPLSSSSNYREFLLVEASKGIEQLLPKSERPNCEIEGTSYAAPQITAGAALRLMQGQFLSK